MSGLPQFAKKFFEELAKNGAGIVKEIAWDDESKTFKGLFRRVKQAIHGPEEIETNAEKILAEANACGMEEGQPVYLQLGVPGVPMIKAGESIANQESSLDAIALALILQDGLESAVAWIKQAWPDVKSNQIGLEPCSTGFSLTWPVEKEKFFVHDFDISGNPVGMHREVSIQELFLKHYLGDS